MKKSAKKQASFAGLSYGAFKSAQHFNEHHILNSSRGHGFAAEKLNHLSDVFNGNDAKIVGANNLKSGPDRVVNNEFIQTKYYQSPGESIDAMFTKGKYKYLNADGTPMQVEVPKDQYEQALKFMEDKISKGQVPGVKDIAEAKKLVREGTATYQQAVNMAKAGTIESLKYDAKTGAVVAAYAFGISALITFAHSLWSGKSLEEATIASLQVSSKVFGVTVVSHIATQQISRTVISKSLERGTNILAMKMPEALRSAVARGVSSSGGSSVATVSKVLRSNVITAVVVTTVLSIKDLHRFSKNEISGLQCFKNICVTGGSVGAGALGGLGGAAFVAWCVSNPAGWATAAGAIVVGGVGSLLGGKLTKTLVDLIGPDDAEVLKDEVNEHLVRAINDYLITKDEMPAVSEGIKKIDWDKELRKIFSLKKRDKYIYDLFEPILKEITANRRKIAC